MPAEGINKLFFIVCITHLFREYFLSTYFSDSLMMSASLSVNALFGMLRPCHILTTFEVMQRIDFSGNFFNDFCIALSRSSFGGVSIFVFIGFIFMMEVNKYTSG